MNNEIKHHLAAMNEAWQRYDKLEHGEHGSHLAPLDRLKLRDSINETYKKHWWWLVEHGIDDLTLVYDSENKTFAMPT